MDPSSFDFSMFINTIFVAMVGSFFGSIVGAWVTHHYQRKRDDIAWEREKEKLKQQFQHEGEILEKQFQNRMSELEIQLQQRVEAQFREAITKGVDTPEKTIAALTNLQNIVDELRGREPGKIQIKSLR